ncbi:hypothetical protein D3C86_1912440 [compost metagenome]
MAEAVVLGAVASRYFLEFEASDLLQILEVFRTLDEASPNASVFLKLAKATLK